MIFDIEIFGDQVFIEKLDVMSSRVNLTKPAMRVVAGYLMTQTEKRFVEQGPGWAPLTAKWATRKSAAGHDPRILRMKRTGSTLMRSVTRPGAAGQILKINQSSLVFGSALEYAETMQKGYAPGNIPARPFLVVTPQNRIAIRNIIKEYIMAPFERTSIPAFGGGTLMRGPRGRFTGVTREGGEF